MKIDPGGCVVEFPHSGWCGGFGEELGFMGVFEAFPGPEPDAELLLIHFAVSISASSTGTIPGVFWTPRLRALECDVLDGTVTAASTGAEVV